MLPKARNHQIHAARLPNHCYDLLLSSSTKSPNINEIQLLSFLLANLPAVIENQTFGVD